MYFEANYHYWPEALLSMNRLYWSQNNINSDRVLNLLLIMKVLSPLQIKNMQIITHEVRMALGWQTNVFLICSSPYVIVKKAAWLLWTLRDTIRSTNVWEGSWQFPFMMNLYNCIFFSLLNRKSYFNSWKVCNNYVILYIAVNAYLLIRREWQGCVSLSVACESW